MIWDGKKRTRFTRERLTAQAEVLLQLYEEKMRYNTGDTLGWAYLLGIRDAALEIGVDGADLDAVSNRILFPEGAKR
jgi:hypothetical protein